MQVGPPVYPGMHPHSSGPMQISRGPHNPSSHDGIEQSYPVQPDRHWQLSGPTQVPLFSHINEHTAEMARITWFPASATYSNTSSVRLPQCQASMPAGLPNTVSCGGCPSTASPHPSPRAPAGIPEIVCAVTSARDANFKAKPLPQLAGASLAVMLLAVEPPRAAAVALPGSNLTTMTTTGSDSPSTSSE